MTSVTDEAKAEAAKTALASDIRELKHKSGELVANASSKLPWVIGGAVGLLTVAVVLATRSGPRSFLPPPRRPLFAKVVRAAALSAASLIARRLATRGVDAILPQLTREPSVPPIPPGPSAEPEAG